MKKQRKQMPPPPLKCWVRAPAAYRSNLYKRQFGLVKLPLPLTREDKNIVCFLF